LNGTNSYEIDKIILHPEWDPQISNYRDDIAIAVLKELVEFGGGIDKICVNTQQNPIESFINHNATVAGWGLTEFNKKKTVLELREVTVPIVDQKLCNVSRNLQTINSETSFCAGTKDGVTGPCRGNFKINLKF
jgi:hypothetical protein